MFGFTYVSYILLSFVIICLCVLWQGSVSGLPMHLSFHKGIQTYVSYMLLSFVLICLCVLWQGSVSSPFTKAFKLMYLICYRHLCLFVCVSPLLPQGHSNLCVLYVIVICAYLFVCLVTRERFGLAHAPLLSQRHSNFRVLHVSVNNFACVFVRIVARKRSGLPMHISFHKGVRNCVSHV